MNDALFFILIGRGWLSKYGELPVMGIIFFWSALIIVPTWFPLKEGLLGEYKDKCNNSNPLYRKGYFRKPSPKKNDRHILSELTGFFYRDIYVIIQLILLFLYGIYCTFQNYIDERVCLIWAFCTILPSAVIQDYYNHILRKLPFDDEDWGPFRYTSCGGSLADKFQIEYDGFNQFFQKIILNLDHFGFHYVKKYEVCHEGECLFFLRKRRRRQEVISIIYLKEMLYEQEKEMREIFNDFYEKQIGTGYWGTPVDCMNILCADKESSRFRILLNRPIIQEGIRFAGINAGILLDKRRLYISKAGGIWGIKRYRRMRRVILEEIFYDLLSSQE